MPRHTLIKDQETRWSSTYTMLERFLLQKINYSDLHRIWKVWHSNTRKSWLGNFAKRCGVATSAVVLRWMCDSPRTGCAWRTKIYIFVEHDLYCCLLPRCEALRTFRSGFLIVRVALPKLFTDVVNFCDEENSCILAAVPSAKWIMITLQETGCKGVVELKKAFQQNMNRYFYREDIRQQCNLIEKSQVHVVSTLLDPK